MKTDSIILTLDELVEKYSEMGKTDFIDSCTMMQFFGYKLHMIDGPYENIKITTALERFDTLTFRDFVKELSKQKIMRKCPVRQQELLRLR